MKKLSYREVLEYYYTNIATIRRYQPNRYLCDYIHKDNSYHLITFDLDLSVFSSAYINSRGLREDSEVVYAIFGKHKNYKNEYFVFPEDYNPYSSFNNKPMHPLPETPDEWFNFLLMHQYNEDEFKLFKKIVQYYEN